MSIPTFTEKENRLYEDRCRLNQMWGMSESDAKMGAMESLKAAIAASKESGRYDTGPLGQVVLGNMKENPNDPAVKVALNDGVRESDVLDWWNLNDVERRLLIESDMTMLLAQVRVLLKSGMTLDEAFPEAARTNATFGDPTNTIASGDNRPLPWELKLRVLRWKQQKGQDYLRSGWNGDCRKHSSANAFIRSLIRSGAM